MKFRIDRTGESGIGTGLVGYVNATFGRLVEVFGEPEDGEGYKTSAEWTIVFEDGTVATIYDYKTADCYCGEGRGTDKSENTEWHVGGRNAAALAHVKIALRTT